MRAGAGFVAVHRFVEALQGNKSRKQGCFATKQGNNAALLGKNAALLGNNAALLGNNLQKLGNIATNQANNVVLLGNIATNEGSNLAMLGNIGGKLGNIATKQGNFVAKDGCNAGTRANRAGKHDGIVPMPGNANAVAGISPADHGDGVANHPIRSDLQATRARRLHVDAIPIARTPEPFHLRFPVILSRPATGEAACTGPVSQAETEQARDEDFSSVFAPCGKSHDHCIRKVMNRSFPRDREP